MLYKKVAWYDCEEGEQFGVDKLYEALADYTTTYAAGDYIEDIEYKGKQCELYCEYGYDYTLYEVIEEDDPIGEMIDRRYQEYKDSKYEN